MERQGEIVGHLATHQLKAALELGSEGRRNKWWVLLRGIISSLCVKFWPSTTLLYLGR
jgi:hypothetical protein